MGKKYVIFYTKTFKQTRVRIKHLNRTAVYFRFRHVCRSPIKLVGSYDPLPLSRFFFAGLDSSQLGDQPELMRPSRPAVPWNSQTKLREFLDKQLEELCEMLKDVATKASDIANTTTFDIYIYIYINKNT